MWLVRFWQTHLQQPGEGGQLEAGDDTRQRKGRLKRRLEGSLMERTLPARGYRQYRRVILSLEVLLLVFTWSASCMGCRLSQITPS